MSTIEGPQTISSGALKILGGKLSITSFPNTYSLEFDGVNDYIEGGGNSPAGAFTISFWIKIETPPMSNDTDYWFGGASNGILISIISQDLHWAGTLLTSLNIHRKYLHGVHQGIMIFH